MAKKKVTSASEWVTSETVELPSGRVAELKAPDMASLLLSDGSLPDSVLNKFLFASDEDQDDKMDVKAFKQMLPLMNHVVMATFVSPKVVESGADYETEINVSDVVMSDKEFVLSWAMSGGNIDATERLAKFSEQ